MDRAIRIAEFLDRAGWGDASRAPLTADASFRSYERLDRDNRRALLMNAPPPMEDVRPFIRMSDHLCALGLSAPKILARGRQGGPGP